MGEMDLLKAFLGWGAVLKASEILGGGFCLSEMLGDPVPPFLKRTVSERASGTAVLCHEFAVRGAPRALPKKPLLSS